MTLSYLLLACRVMLAGVFVVSLVSKVRSRAAYADFGRSVVDWRVVPRRWSAPVVAGVVAGEAGVVLLLALPWTVLVGFVAGGLLLAAFTGAIAVTLRRGPSATCRCFGAGKTRLGTAHVVRNLLLVAVCVTGAVAATMTAGLPSNAPGLGLTLTAAVVGVVFVVHFDEIAALRELWARPTVGGRK